MAANRRCLHTVLRHYPSFLSSSSTSSLHHLQTLKTSPPTQTHPDPQTPESITLTSHSIFTRPTIHYPPQYRPASHFSTNRTTNTSDDDDDDDEDEEEDEDEGGGEEDYESDSPVNSGGLKREYTPEEKAAEAAAIGYEVIGPLPRTERVFKPYEPAFAVVQIGSHQFKVSNGDSIFTEKLKFCEVNEKVILNKVLMLGTSSQTIIGRPILPDAAVHAVVEEHALDAKVIIFKKKRRKNYRRTKGHRQELTKLRITNIEGIEKPVTPEAVKPQKTAAKKSGKVAAESPEKVAVPA